MVFSSDSQRKAAFANMMNGPISGLNRVKFSNDPRKELQDAFGITGAISSGTCSACGGPAGSFKSALEEKEYSMSGLCSACQDKVFGGNEMELDEEYAAKQAAAGEERAEDRLSAREELEMYRKSVRDNPPKKVKITKEDLKKLDDADFSKKSDIYDIIKEAGIKPNQYAQAYIDALAEAEDMYGDRGVQSQAAYIASNLVPENDEQELAVEKIMAISRGEDLPTELPKKDPNVMTEIQLEKMIDGVMDFTAEYPRDEDGKIGLDAFKAYAEKRGVSVDKVLKANDWVSDVLSSEALTAVKAADKKIKIKEWDLD